MYLLTRFRHITKKRGCISAVHVGGRGERKTTRKKKTKKDSKEEAVTAGCANTLNHASVRRDIKGGQEAKRAEPEAPTGLISSTRYTGTNVKNLPEKDASVHPFSSFEKGRRRT